MTQLPDKARIRPGQEADSQKIATTTSISTVPTATDLLGDLDARAESLAGRFVVQVQVDGEKYRTKVYMSARAAENAARRANERGKVAHVSLCRLLPVGVVVGLGGGLQ